mgnify:CR=1 FL=1
MLEIKNVYKTFNAGTVNEKVALKGLDLTLETATLHGHRRQRRGQIHDAERRRGRLAGGYGQNHY